METQTPSLKKYGFLSWLSLIIGVTSFFLVFVIPTRIANIGSAIGDSITLSLMVIEILISILDSSKKRRKRLSPSSVYCFPFPLSFTGS